MTRVLVAHNYYRSSMPSGENDVVDEDVALLRARGIDVATFARHSDDIDLWSFRKRAALPVRPIHPGRAVAEFRSALRDHRAEIVHLHNPYPLISPQVIRTSLDEGARVVQTVHNYRHVCVAGTFFRDGHPCEDCRGSRLRLPAVVHGCYRGSRPQSLVMAIASAVHDTTFRLVSRFLPVSDFVADHLTRAGLHRISVVPNAIADPGPPAPAGRDVLFVGRLSVEKGIALLAEAWRRSNTERRLLIIGDGPDRAIAERLAGSRGVEFLGRRTKDEVAALMREVGVVVVPSTWYEGFPRVVVEAYAHGRPVAATRLGSLASVVDATTGWHFEPNAASLAKVLDDLDAVEIAARGRAARARYLATFTPDVRADALLRVYDEVSAAAST